MDVINLISKDPAYPDAAIIEPDAPYQPGYAHYANGPRLHEYLKHMNREVLTKYNAFTVGEMPVSSVAYVPVTCEQTNNSSLCKIQRKSYA